MSLIQKRDELFTITKTFLDNLNLRKQLVSEIQELKKQDGLSSFDPNRVVFVFENLKNELSFLSIDELFGFSLFLESHALQNNKNYPQWSKGVHLKSSSGQSFEGINLILLNLLRSDLVEKLDLDPEFRAILS